MSTTFGPTFGEEVIAAGLGGLPFAWSPFGKITGRERLTAAQNATLDAVIAAHDPTKQLIVYLPLNLVRDRAEAEIVNGGSAWDKLIDWVLVTPIVAGRRDMFTKFMWKNNPIRQDSTVIRNWFTQAGVSAAAIERIMALPLPD